MFYIETFLCCIETFLSCTGTLHRTCCLPRKILIGSEKSHEEFTAAMFPRRFGTFGTIDEASDEEQTSKISAVKAKKWISDNGKLKSYNGDEIQTRNHFTTVIATNSISVITF